MIYLDVLGHAFVFGLVGAVIGGAFAHNDLIAFVGGCTGVLVGALLGATRSVIWEMRNPERTRMALYPRTARDLDDDELREKLN